MASDKTVSIFSNETIRLKNNENDEDWITPDKSSRTVSIRLNGARWHRQSRHLSEALAYPPALCDRQNKIDDADDALRLALPPGSLIKTTQLGEEDPFIVIYSATQNPVEYEIHAALVSSAGSGYKVLDDRTLADGGNYCGLQPMNRKDAYLIEVNRPSASREFLALHVYHISK